MRTNIFDPKFLLRRSKQEIVKNYAEQHACGYLIDLGCGSLNFKPLFSGQVKRYIGLDYPGTSQHMGYGTSKFEIAADVRAVPLQSECVDSILLLDVLEHVFEVDQVLSSVSRVLKPGGKLLITTPFIYPVHGRPYDFHRFSFFALEKHLACHNLQVLESTVLGNYGTVLAILLNRFLYRAIWGRKGCFKIIGMILMPALRLMFAFINLVGWGLDIITSKKPVWVYLEGAVVCRKEPQSEVA